MYRNYSGQLRNKEHTELEEPLILRVARHIHRASKVGRPPISA
jgi:hypothetical protein